MAIAARGLETWDCIDPRCQAVNVAHHDHCTVCHTPRSGRSAVVKRIAGQELEEFCRRHFARNDRRPVARLDMADGEVFLTLTPSEGEPAIFLLEHNTAIPCDNFGRRSW
jgi:hypothetical protein